MAALSSAVTSLSIVTITLLLVQQRPVHSMTLSEDRDFLKKWSSLMGYLTHEQACQFVRSSPFKRGALKSCAQSEYDASVALVCGDAGGSTGESGHHGSTTNLGEDKDFQKNWMALYETFSLDCKTFSVSRLAQPMEEMTHDESCRYMKSDRFKTSALAACSQEEYDAAVDLVCDSGHGSTTSSGSTVYLACSVVLLSMFLHLLRKV